MSEKLTKKQKQILEYLESFTKKMGFPPTFKEIMKEFNFASPTAVTGHINALEKKGYIKKSHKGRHRGISFLNANENSDDGDNVMVPILGDVKAGLPLNAPEYIEDTISVPRFIAGNGEVFLMRVKGDSMINVGIFEGDYLFVRKCEDANNGEIIVAAIESEYAEGEEVTVKRFFREEKRVRLVAENDNYEPIYAENISIYGKVQAVLRMNVN